jgi:aminopeptidase N
MKSFGVEDEMLKDFKELPIKCFEFKLSPKISTYLYSIMAGPYHCFELPSDLDKKLRQRIFCRQSMAKYVKNMTHNWFDVSIKGIAFYEDIFSTPFPFEKLDHIFVADYNMGAMENVGMVLYTESYVQRDELFTNVRKQNMMVTLLHEISHMWFGNLVTMKWWDDLWLNESFANFISYICLDEAKGLEQYDLAWSIFLDENFWGLKED